jgi:Tfp pilus assembly protein PilN
MHFNLLPQEERCCRWKQIKHDAFFLIIGIMSVSAFCFAVVGTIFSAQVDKQKMYYTDQLQPVQTWIIQNNQVCDQIAREVSGIQKNNAATSPWTSVLVCLADTKPNDVEVRSLQIRQKRVCINAITLQAPQIQDWQKKLQKSGGFASVSVTRINHKEPKSIAFDLEMEIADDTLKPENNKT